MALQIVGLTKAFGARTLFDGVAFTIGPGDRLAVVGRNGAGKTTLLRCLAGQINPDAGTIAFPKGAVVALHDQRPPLDRDVTLGEYVAEGLAGLTTVEAELRALEVRMAGGDHGPEVLAEYDRAQREFERLGGYESHAWLERVERGLGIEAAWLDRPLQSFSGGELTRASLARALVSRPDVLLLDEPTNHLDLGSVEWLESALSEVNAAVVIVSHDRWFLESVANVVLDMDPERPKVWNMGYSTFRRAKAEALARQAQLAEAQAKEIARLERFVERWRAGTKSRQAASRQKTLDRIERVDAPSREKSLAFGFPKSEQPVRVVVEVDDLAIGPKDHPLIEHVTCAIERGQRVAIVGPNGAGKTTLVETLMGVRRPLSGRFTIGHRVEVGYFSQHADELDPMKTLVESVLAGTSLNNTQARSLLGRFLFGADMVEKRVEMLSGGERRRVSLVQMIARGGNVLVFDEPTNHLDIESREALEEALMAFDGTIILITHDRALIDLIATHTLSLEDRTVVMREGGYTDLLRQLEERTASPPPPPAPSKPKASPPPVAHPTRKRRNLGKAAKLEAQIAALEDELKEIETKLATPEVFSDHEQVTALGERHRQVQEEVSWRMAEWEEVAAD